MNTMFTGSGPRIMNSAVSDGEDPTRSNQCVPPGCGRKWRENKFGMGYKPFFGKDTRQQAIRPHRLGSQLCCLSLSVLCKIVGSVNKEYRWTSSFVLVCTWKFNAVLLITAMSWVLNRKLPLWERKQMKWHERVIISPFQEDTWSSLTHRPFHPGQLFGAVQQRLIHELDHQQVWPWLQREGPLLILDAYVSSRLSKRLRWRQREMKWSCEWNQHLRPVQQSHIGTSACWGHWEWGFLDSLLWCERVRPWWKERNCGTKCSDTDRSLRKRRQLLFGWWHQWRRILLVRWFERLGLVLDSWDAGEVQRTFIVNRASRIHIPLYTLTTSENKHNSDVRLNKSRWSGNKHKYMLLIVNLDAYAPRI